MLVAGAPSLKQSNLTTVFQQRFLTLQTRFENNEIAPKQWLDN